ncbi:MAG: hypothetical protein AVDCRST_MAG67-1003, partial [uncultured Solirubrobacteraceae bacterium]
GVLRLSDNRIGEYSVRSADRQARTGPSRAARRRRRRRGLAGHDRRGEHLHGRLPRSGRRAVAPALPRRLRVGGLHAARAAERALGRGARALARARARRHGLRPAARDAPAREPVGDRGRRVRRGPRRAGRGLGRSSLGAL